MDDKEIKDEGAVFTYIGDPNDDGSGPRVIDVFGHEFTKGEPALVRDPVAVRKLRGHNHFLADGDEAPEFVKKGAADELPALSLEDMKDVARGEGLEFSEDTTKAKLMAALRRHRKNA